MLLLTALGKYAMDGFPITPKGNENNTCLSELELGIDFPIKYVSFFSF